MTTEIEPYFDFEYMTRWAAGPAWRRMSPQQRAGVQKKLKARVKAKPGDTPSQILKVALAAKDRLKKQEKEEKEEDERRVK